MELCPILLDCIVITISLLSSQVLALLWVIYSRFSLWILVPHNTALYISKTGNWSKDGGQIMHEFVGLGDRGYF